MYFRFILSTAAAAAVALCFAAGSGAAPVKDTPVGSLTAHLDKLAKANTRTDSQRHIQDMRLCLITDPYITRESAADESVIVRAILRHGVAQLVPAPVVSEQLTVLGKWLKRRDDSETARHARQTLNTFTNIKRMLDESEEDASYERLVEMQLELEPYYADGKVPFWPIQQLVRFIGFPGTQPHRQMFRLSRLFKSATKVSCLQTQLVHELYTNVVGLTDIIPEQLLINIAQELRDVGLYDCSAGASDYSDLRGQLKMWSKQLTVLGSRLQSKPKSGR